MKKLIALALSLALLLGCVSALAETEQKTLQATIDMNGAFALKCYLPEGYVVQNAGMTGGTYVASISHATDSSKPAMMLSIAFDELLADIDRLNDLDDEALAKIAATFAEEDDIEVTYSETHLGTKMMVVKDMTDTTDYVDFFTIYKGYEMEFVLVKEKTLSTLIQTNETYESTQIDAFFESKPKIDAFLKIDANVQRQEYKMAS